MSEDGTSLKKNTLSHDRALGIRRQEQLMVRFDGWGTNSQNICGALYIRRLIPSCVERIELPMCIVLHAHVS